MSRAAPLWLALVLLSASLSPLLGPADLAPPGAWTDALGRPLLARLCGAAAAFALPAAMAGLIACAGSALLALLAQLPGLGAAASGLCAALAALPRLVLALLLCAALAEGPATLALAVGLAGLPAGAAALRRRADQLQSEGLIEAARLNGLPLPQLLADLLRWELGPELRLIAAAAARELLWLETSLSWMGHHGVQEPQASLGNMLSLALAHPEGSPLALALPLLGLLLTALALSALAQRDARA